jgi:condensin complex subunit 3
MILLYFFPTTAEQENSKTKQCLTYFFPAYCHSSASHQKSLSKVTIPALEELCNTFNDLENDETMADPMKISEMLVDWTDSRKLAR